MVHLFDMLLKSFAFYVINLRKSQHLQIFTKNFAKFFFSQAIFAKMRKQVLRFKSIHHEGPD
jgi:hypothetical protein